jgi:hypothetical protein
MSLRVLLFVPNLIGYLRLLLIVAAFHVPGVFDQQVSCYPARLRHRSSLCPRQPASQLASQAQPASYTARRLLPGERVG